MNDTIANLIPLITDVLRVVIALVICGAIIPWVVRYGIPWLKEKQLYDFIKKVVRAAEKISDSGQITKEAKLDYVVSVLKKNGVTVDATVRALIECAVCELEDDITRSMMSLVDAINDADDASEFVYTNGKIRTFESDSRIDDEDTENG